jgi:diaminopimelate decarboxylase
MADLMRPGMYNAYHEISFLGKENEEKIFVYDIVDSLCKNIDKFCIDRKLPKIEIGDIIIIWDLIIMEN